MSENPSHISSTGRAERIIWWTTLVVLVGAIIFMVGLWN